LSPSKDSVSVVDVCLFANAIGVEGTDEEKDEVEDELE